MNKLFKWYIDWVAMFSDSVKFNDEVSICDLIRGTILALAVTMLIICVFAFTIMITIMPFLELFFKTPLDLFVMSIFWWFLLIATWFNIRVKPKFMTLLKKTPIENHIPKEPNKFKLIASDMYTSIKTKTCFKVKIRD